MRLVFPFLFYAGNTSLFILHLIYICLETIYKTSCNGF